MRDLLLKKAPTGLHTIWNDFRVSHFLHFCVKNGANTGLNLTGAKTENGHPGTVGARD